MADDSKMFIGRMRRDGKFPVQFVFPISGKRSNNIMTKDQIDETIVTARRRGSPYIVISRGGYHEPEKTKQELEADIAEATGQELP